MTKGRSPSGDLAQYESIASRVSLARAQLFSESDRGCALVGGAMLDEAIAALLRAYFVKDASIDQALLTKPGAPLSTFSARIITARALGLLSNDLYRDLEVIRKIRNLAAHFDHKGERTTEFAFTHPDVSDRCRALRLVPPEFNAIPPRAAFILLVGLVASIFAEHAANASIARSHAGHEMAITMLLKVSPVVPYRDYLSNFLEARNANEIGSGEHA